MVLSEVPDVAGWVLLETLLELEGLFAIRFSFCFGGVWLMTYLV